MYASRARRVDPGSLVRESQKRDSRWLNHYTIAQTHTGIKSTTGFRHRDDRPET